MPKIPKFVTHRNTGKQAAIVFVHGFSGEPEKTFGKFPEYLKAEFALKEWDIYSFGYPTSLNFDLVGIWSADPQILSCADGLRTAVTLDPLNSYKSLALVAHSMGGLVVQRALVDDADFAALIGHVFLFGTPSGGLTKAGWFKFWKRQLDDMAEGGRFITELRGNWHTCFAKNPPFKLWTVAGDQDEFVPRTSSIDPFPLEQRRVVNGDHLSIVKPCSSDSPSVQIVVDGLTKGAAAAGPLNAARIAVQDREFHKIINDLWPKREGLDEQGLVQLALALEAVGRQPEAIELLQKVRRDYTDAIGVLAGRLKRRWLAERQRADAEQALALYSKGYGKSVEAGKPAQAFYHAINLAFMELAYHDDMAKCREFALKSIEECARSKTDKWSLATEGEAHLLLGQPDLAMEKYQGAIKVTPPPSPRELDSMLQQAMRDCSLLGDEDTAKKLKKLFRGR